MCVRVCSPTCVCVSAIETWQQKKENKCRQEWRNTLELKQQFPLCSAAAGSLLSFFKRNETQEIPTLHYHLQHPSVCLSVPVWDSLPICHFHSYCFFAVKWADGHEVRNAKEHEPKCKRCGITFLFLHMWQLTDVCKFFLATKQ